MQTLALGKALYHAFNCFLALLFSSLEPSASGDFSCLEMAWQSITSITGSPKGWEWAEEWEIDDVIYRHGHTGNDGGRTPHLTLAERRRRSMVVGHYHTVAGIEWSATDDDVIFGMCVGCGMDSNEYAFDYQKHGIKKPMVACAVVVEGWLPVLVKMNLGNRILRLT